MAIALRNDSLPVSELFNLEIRSLRGEKPTRIDHLSAVRNDVRQRLPISKVVFFKHFSANPLLNGDDLRELICILTEGVALALSSSPDAARSYSHAAIVCQTDLLSRDP